MTPILIFFSWAWAETAMPSATAATTSPPSRPAALRTSIKTSLENCALRFLFLLTPITWGAPTDVKRLATPARRQGVAGHANCLSVPNRASGNVEVLLTVRPASSRVSNHESNTSHLSRCGQKAAPPAITAEPLRKDEVAHDCDCD